MTSATMRDSERCRISAASSWPQVELAVAIDDGGSNGHATEAAMLEGTLWVLQVLLALAFFLPTAGCFSHRRRTW